MKSVICIILSITLLLSMTACGNTIVPNHLPATEKMDVQEAEIATQPEQAQTERHRILIAYFSVPENRNTEGVDAIAGDLYRIKTVREYPLDHDALLDFADEEQADDARPELVNRIENPEQYDIIILGFPNWWAESLGVQEETNMENTLKQFPKEAEMERPYVVCHMLTSLDGKIDGSWFSDPACSPALKAYGSLRNTFDCNATIYGTTTALGSYSDGLAGDVPRSEILYPKEDHIAQPDFGNYIVCLDANGILGWNSGWSEKKGRAKAHVIEVLTDSVSNDYLAYLQSRGISYVFAGRDEIDCALLLDKLQNLFGISRIILAGGGITDWNFAKAGLIDELSIVIAPVADGSTKAVSIFEDVTNEGQSISMKLKDVKLLEGNALWLTYTK